MGDKIPSKDQMIIESYLTMKQIWTRLDRHGVEHREDMDKLAAERREDMTKIEGKLESIETKLDGHAESITKLEAERSTLSKVVGMLIALLGGGAGGWLTKHL